MFRTIFFDDECGDLIDAVNKNSNSLDLVEETERMICCAEAEPCHINDFDDDHDLSKWRFRDCPKCNNSFSMEEKMRRKPHGKKGSYWRCFICGYNYE